MPIGPIAQGSTACPYRKCRTTVGVTAVGPLGGAIDHCKLGAVVAQLLLDHLVEDHPNGPGILDRHRVNRRIKSAHEVIAHHAAHELDDIPETAEPERP